ncbi:unnamed protein product [Prorocentrum cordatum]|uniref:Uncharacterized protein n=1 Tax=Prorocentrum cordatum TaxID=2364126 RepID=A0ABN9WRL1_9DINO|nr:unnamed protein product [Polarella glacialis]
MVASQLAFGEPPVGSKDDLRKAYHQVGRGLTAVRVVQLFWDPQRRELVGRDLLSQDFGTGGAVANSNIVFRCLRDILYRWFFINADNYFDDYWTWEPPWSASSARFVLREVLQVLEYDVKEAKSEHGTQLPLLGLVFTSRKEGPEVGNRSCRREPLARECEEVARSRPQAGQASSCIGRLVFASRGLQGKAGAHARWPLFDALGHVEAAQHAGEWPPQARVALRLWAHLLRRARPRSLPLASPAAPVAILYGDAALSSQRAAAMLVFPGTAPEVREGFSVVLPAQVLDQLGPCRQHAINGAKTWWIAKALEVWGDKIRSHCLYCFGDNSAALAGCVRGYSGSPHVACVVGAVHELLCRRDIRRWFEYVHSDSNPLDAASREEGENALAKLGAKVVKVTPTLSVDLSRYHVC